MRILALTAALLLPLAAHAECGGSFNSFKKGLKSEAVAQGISPAKADACAICTPGVPEKAEEAQTERQLRVLRPEGKQNRRMGAPRGRQSSPGHQRKLVRVRSARRES